MEGEVREDVHPNVLLETLKIMNKKRPCQPARENGEMQVYEKTF